MIYDKGINSQGYIYSVLIEITSYEITERGFDRIWDEIRLKYPSEEYDIEYAKQSHNGRIILVMLQSKKYQTKFLD